MITTVGVDVVKVVVVEIKLEDLDGWDLVVADLCVSGHQVV